MKQIVGLLLTCLVFLFSCSKDPVPTFTINGFDPGEGAANLYVTISGDGFDTIITDTRVAFNGVDATVISTTDTAIVAIVPGNATTGKISVTINNSKVFSAADFVILPGKWTQKGMLPANKGRLLGLGFAVGNKGYMTTGDRIAFYVPAADRINDMLEYDPVTGQWEEKTPLPLKLTGALGMLINNKIYLGIGQTDQGEKTNKFWEYDPGTDEWTEKREFPGEERQLGIGFGVSGKGYAGTGLLNGMWGLKDWWEYDPQTDIWTRKTDFPGTARHFITGFVLNGKIYAGAGHGSRTDWWEYEPANDRWTRKRDFPGKMEWGASGIVLANRGYIMGAGTECWEYIPSSDSWSQKAFLGSRYMGVAFGINNKGYYVTGTTGVNSAAGFLAEDIWEFSPQ